MPCLDCGKSKKPMALASHRPAITAVRSNGKCDGNLRREPRRRQRIASTRGYSGANLAVAHQLLGTALDSNETATELEKASWLDPEQLEISETTAQQIPRISYVDGG